MGTIATESAVFFDLDGVLVDSRPVIESLACQVLLDHGITTESSWFHEFVGPPLRESFASVLQRAGVGEALADVCVRVFRAQYTTRCIESPVYAGIPAALEQISAMAPIAVSTSKQARFARAILDHAGLSDLFLLIVGPEPDWPVEDKLSVLQHTLSEMERGLGHAVVRERCVMIGDRRHDVEAARTLGLRSVAVTWGVGSSDELAAARPDAVVSTPEQLVNVVERFLGDTAGG